MLIPIDSQRGVFGKRKYMYRYTWVGRDPVGHNLILVTSIDDK